MITQNLIIYKFNRLYQILIELDLNFNYEITSFDNQETLNEKLKKIKNYLIISNKKYLDVDNQFILSNTPINIFRLIEKINIEFLKVQFNYQSEVKVSNYIINLNSREILKNNKKLKLTEKEMNTIIYLFKSENPVSIDELQKKVWSYQSDLETHTVETHIYRLRKKFLNMFNDNDFIISKTNGYQIN